MEIMGEAVAYVFLPEGEDESGRLTYRELWDRATEVAAFVSQRDCFGAPVLLLMPSGLEFIVALYGCLLAGAIAVPAPPPHRTRGMSRIRSIILDSSPRLILAGQPVPTAADGTPDPDLADIPWHEVSEILAAPVALRHALPAIPGAHPAILQYTSGSTGSPKGIIITHENAYANILAQQQATADPDAPCLVSWLPVHHDMGLFGNVIAAPVLGGQLVFMPPGAFIQKPARWLNTIARYRAVRSGGPNFAYDLCARAISPEQIDGIDLRYWRTAYNGAEPVRASTLQQFARKFAPYGFQPETWFPCYGLAETTLMVSGARRRRPPVVRNYARDALGEGTAFETNDASVAAQALVSSGLRVSGHAVHVVAAESGTILPERRIGEIWVAGASVSPGFWKRPEATAERFDQTIDGETAKFVRTGDLGFFDDDELFIVSRLDDLIVLRGRNIAPQDIEDAAIRSGTGAVLAAAAFAKDPGDDEQVFLVLEVSRDLRRAEQLDAVAEAARDAVWQATDVALARLVLVRPGSIPRTTSGKVRRRSTRAELADGQIKSVYDQAPAPAAAAPAAPDGLEAEIAAWLERTLSLSEPPDTQKSLHRLGLDSLKTVEFAEWLSTTYSVPYSLTDLLAGASLADIVKAVRRASGSKESAAKVVGATLLRSAVHAHPLTRVQQAIWAEQGRLGANAAFNVPLAIRLPDGTPTATVSSLIRSVAQDHPLLHSHFIPTDEGPVRFVDTLGGVALETVEVSGTPAELARDMAARSRMPFDMQAKPLWRAVLYRWQPDRAALVLTFHHLLCDGSSISALADRLSRSLQHPDAAPVSPSQADPIDLLIGEEAFYLCGREALSDLAFWKQQLSPAPSPLFLPQRHQDMSGDTPVHLERIVLRGARLQQVRAAADAAGVSLPALLLSLYGLLLHRHTGNDDIAIGVITSMRVPQRHGDLMVPLVNPVVVRSGFADTASRPLRDLATAMSNALRTALAHNRLPLAMLVEALRLPMVPGLPPLFQAAFGHMRIAGRLDETSEAALQGPAQTTGLFPLHAQEGSNPVSLSWTEGDDVCFGDFAVHPAWQSRDEVRRLATQFDGLIDAVCTDLDLSAGGIDILPAQERALVDAWSRGARARLAVSAEGLTIHALIQAQAERHPALVAIVESDGSAWSYARLDQQSAVLAGRLRTLGLHPGARVAICMERSALWVASLVAILRAGGSFVVLDPEQPLDRKSFIVADSDAAIVMVTEGADTEFAAGRILFDPGQPLPSEPSDLPTVEQAAAAYVLYTSGSTGRPKGVSVSHAALRERLLWKVEALEMTPADRVLQSIPIIFDPSVWELFTPLLCGAAVVLAPPHSDRDPDQIAALASRHGITMMSCVSGVLVHLGEAFKQHPPLRLRRIITGGEALPVANYRRFQKFSSATVDHFYGPTEATIFCTHLALSPVPAEADAPAAMASVGRPVAGATIDVVDESGRPVPIGGAGEIVIGGLGLALGYINRPEENDKRFVCFDHRPGERFYRSGDSGRWREDGCLEIIGRLDEQIKLRGVRIEPGEIEVILLGAPGVAEVAVGVEQRGTGNVLAAWVAVGDGGPDEDALESYARRHLPYALIPSRFYLIDKLPTLPSGKIDRSALKELTAAHAPPDPVASQAVSSELEATLLRLWRDLLQAPDLQPTDDVFQAGAHSLMVMRLVGRLHGEIGQSVPTAVFFDRRTPRRQALFIEDKAQLSHWDRPTLKLLSAQQNCRNLVCIAAGAGDLVRLEHLSRALGADVTVWGLIPPAVTPAGEAWTIDRLTAAYVELITKMLGSNACVMAGFSAGGPLAHETACRLKAAGHPIDRIILFDSAHPAWPAINVAIFVWLRQRLAALGHETWLSNSWLVQRARQIFEDGGLYIHLAALPHWQGTTFDGPVTIIRGYVTRWLSVILFRPWRHRARVLEYVNANGLHGGLFHNRNVDGVAAIVKRLLIKP